MPTDIPESEPGVVNVPSLFNNAWFDHTIGGEHSGT
jgi:hypothetical protein